MLSVLSTCRLIAAPPSVFLTRLDWDKEQGGMENVNFKEVFFVRGRNDFELFFSLWTIQTILCKFGETLIQTWYIISARLKAIDMGLYDILVKLKIILLIFSPFRKHVFPFSPSSSQVLFSLIILFYSMRGSLLRRE